MTRKILFLFICTVFAVNLYSDVSVGSDVTLFSSYGIADESQKVPSTQDGVYDELKNGHLISGSIKLKGSVENRFSLNMKLTTKSATGSPYLPLSIAQGSASNFSLSLSNIYGTLLISDLLFKSDINTSLEFGKLSKSAADYSISGFGLDSITSVANMSNALNVSINTVYELNDRKQFIYGKKANISLNAAAGAKYGEDVEILYDNDGGISKHGAIVLGEYAPQIFGNLALNNYVLPTGTLSFGITYTMNAKGFYTGNTITASTLYRHKLAEGHYSIPVSLSFAMTEKNIDIITGTANNATDSDSTDFRETMQIAGAFGLSYLKKTKGIIGAPKYDGELAVSGSYKQINHIYRDPINLISLGLDGIYKVTPKVFVGGGAVLGTLTEVNWKTSEDSTALDNYNHTFTLENNYGYEVFAGLDFLSGARLILGFSQKKGLAMGYNIEATNSGMVKFKQYETELSDNLYETMGLFLKATISL